LQAFLPGRYYIDYSHLKSQNIFKTMPLYVQASFTY